MQFGTKSSFLSLWILTCLWLFIVRWNFLLFASTGFYCPLQTSPSTLDFVEFPNVWGSAGLLFEPSVRVVVEHCCFGMDLWVLYVCVSSGFHSSVACHEQIFQRPITRAKVFVCSCSWHSHSSFYLSFYHLPSYLPTYVPASTRQDSQESLNPFKGDSNVLFVNKCGPSSAGLWNY